MTSSANLSASIKALEDILTEEFRSLAATAGWPEYIYNSLTVVSDQNGIGVRVPPALEKEVGDLEYGKVGGPASPVFRRFATHVQSLLANTLVETSLDDLVAEGVIP